VNIYIQITGQLPAPSLCGNSEQGPHGHGLCYVSLPAFVLPQLYPQSPTGIIAIGILAIQFGRVREDPCCCFQ